MPLSVVIFFPSLSIRRKLGVKKNFCLSPAGPREGNFLLASSAGGGRADMNLQEREASVQTFASFGKKIVDPALGKKI